VTGDHHLLVATLHGVEQAAQLRFGFEGRRQMMATAVRSGPTLEVGRPRPIFTFSYPPLRLACVPCSCYAVSADGQRFYGIQDLPVPPTPPVTHLQLVLNWAEELKARVAAGPAKEAA